MGAYEKYEAVIGLEVHIQLLTRSKAFSSDPAEFGAQPNVNISPVTLALPGTLPRHNKKVIEYAIRLGLAVQLASLPWTGDGPRPGSTSMKAEFPQVSGSFVGFSAIATGTPGSPRVHVN